MRRIILAALIALTTHAAFAQGRQPNIWVIAADDMGYADTGFTGSKDIPTPNIDALALSGTRFSSAYAKPVCSPTRAAMMTGRYPERFGHEFNPGETSLKGLTLAEKTLAERLKPAGYATALIGKWHLGVGDNDELRPTRRGFDEFYGFLHGKHDYFTTGQDHEALFRNETRVLADGYLTDSIGREAVDFITRHAAEPWFMLTNFNAVHLPAQASNKYLNRFPNITNQTRKIYAAKLSAMDDAIGLAVAKLKELGLEEDTLIFFLSDNGAAADKGGSNAPFSGYKGNTLEGGIRVPFVVSWKGKVAAGAVYDKPVIALDISETALAAAGVAREPESPADGVNLLPYLTDATLTPHEALYWRYGYMMAVLKDGWKLVKPRVSGTPMSSPATVTGAKLFNLANDVGEKTNLASTNPAKVNELATLWQQWNAPLPPPAWSPGD